MKIKWVVDCQIEIAISESDMTQEMRHIGDVDEAEIVGYGTSALGARYPQLQFEDGAVSLGVSENWFVIL